MGTAHGQRITAVSGMAVGAALVYRFRPDRGGRRRALVRDKVVRGSRLTARRSNATMRDVQIGRVASPPSPAAAAAEEVDDTRLLERVRPSVAFCSHPHAIRRRTYTRRSDAARAELADESNAADHRASVRGCTLSSTTSSRTIHPRDFRLPGDAVGGSSFDLRQPTGRRRRGRSSASRLSPPRAGNRLRPAASGV